MDYGELKKVAEEIYIEAGNQNILSKVYWYSPESRKLKPASKIGYYDKDPSGVRFSYGCKLIMVFPRLAFNDLAPIINRHMPQDHQIVYREDFEGRSTIGFDVYQRVEELRLFVEPNSMSFEEGTVEALQKKAKLYADCQDETMEGLADLFKNALAHLKKKNDPKAELTVRRYSGVRHRMIRILPALKTTRAGFSDLVLVFGSSSNHLPLVTLPKPPNPERKRRCDSKAIQFKADPTKYYDSFGIYEIYDK